MKSIVLLHLRRFLECLGAVCPFTPAIRKPTALGIPAQACLTSVLRFGQTRVWNLLPALVVLMCAAGAQAQTWTQMSNVPNISAYNPMLLTDGTILVQDGDNSDWWKLTPDSFGNYATGTWTQLASTPGYGPLYYASQVMPNGQVFTMGGEYNFGNPVWQTTGYIYDPVLDQWTFVSAPNAWGGGMGDTGSITLPNGTILVADPLSNELALFDPASGTFGAPFVNGKFDVNDEEGLTLLPNGTVLTVDTTSPNSEIFNPATGMWTFAGNTPATLVGGGEEIGPQVLRPDGTVICFGGGGNNCIYDTNTATWSLAPAFPFVGGSQLDCADAPACLLPSGNVLVMTSPGTFNPGVQFFEWDGTNMNPAPNTPLGPGEPSFVGNMLMLPNGQVMLTEQSNTVMFYTSVGNPNPAWAPNITSVPSLVAPGESVLISGTQFNGLSGCSAYGDDEQNYTNYPLIRITNNATGHVFYCKEFNPSTMGICTGSQIVSTNFTVPLTIESGPSTIQVVTNGVASQAVDIAIVPPIAVSLSPSTVLGGNPVAGIATLNAPAPPGGTLLKLASSSSSATLPATVTVAAGTTSASFSIATTAVTSIVAAVITATSPTTTGQATLTITPPILTAVSVSPTSATGGSPATGTVTLNGAASSGGSVITLSSSSTDAGVPASVTVLAGTTTATFAITTKAVETTVTATITATQGAIVLTATLTINPATLQSLSVAPPSVLGGTSATGTATMNAAVATGGAVINLTSSSTSATLPSSITVASGASTATFVIQTTAVSSSTSVTLTGTQGVVTQTTTFKIVPATVSSVSFAPPAVIGGSPSTGTFTLTGAAGSAGATVNLSSSSSSAQAPATATVAAGATTGSFTVTTSPVSTTTTVTITASLNGGAKAGTLTINIPNLRSVTVAPTSVVGGNSAQGAVNLSGVAGTGGITVTLSSSAGAMVPPSVVVAGGASNATFNVGTIGQASTITATISASLSGATQTATLTITAATLVGFTVAPNPVTGGDAAVGTVGLNGFAPSGGVIVTLSSISKNVTLPASVTVPSGAMSANFSMKTAIVSTTQTATITAQSGSAFQSVTLSITPATLQSVSLEPTAVVGGSDNTVTGTVALTGPVPSPGKTVTLKSSNTSVATVPASVKVASGAATASFTVTHKPVQATETVTITATYNGVQQSATLTLNPFEIVSVSVSPSSVGGGTKSFGMIVLNAEPGKGSGPIAIKLTSTSKSIVPPATANVPIGLLNGLFDVTTLPVATTTTGTITATYKSSSQKTTLTVQPASLISVTVSPTSVKGSATTAVSGKVSLSGLAPTGGLVVTLASSNSAAAKVPATVKVAAGQATATFKVTHAKVTQSTAVTISATLGSVTSNATLTVTP